MESGKHGFGAGRMNKEILAQYHWTYQCHRCFIKSGCGYTGNSADAYDNAPMCCGSEAMHPVRGNIAGVRFGGRIMNYRYEGGEACSES